MALADDLERIAAAAATPDDRVVAVIAAELLDGGRVYLCSFESEAWLALDDEARPVESRERVRAAASLAALCEVVEDLAGVEAAAPRLATNAYLDGLGARLGPSAAPALEQAFPAVEELAAQVVARHRTPLA